MKKLFFATVLGVASVVSAAPKDPNAFADYGSGMASDKNLPMAVEWHNANRDALEKETSLCAIAGFVENESSAAALLSKIKGAYKTDPMVAVQIAAVSQYVMTAKPSCWAFWTWFSDSPRQIWTKALLEAADTAKDPYVVQLCVDQLRWCAYPEQAAELCAIGKKAECEAVKQMIRMAVAEINPDFAAGKCSKCCKGSSPYGSWALKLPYDRMNAGHLIFSKGANGKPAATLLWRWGSPKDIPAEDIVMEKDGFTITFGNLKPKDLPQDKGAWRRNRMTAKITGDWASCIYQQIDGNGKLVGEPLTFSGKRNPKIGKAPDLKSAKRGAPIDILAGSIEDFQLMETNKVNGWTLKDGILSNRILRGPNGKSLHKNGNLRTKRADFFDFNLKYDVRVLPGCNSGVYLRGIYEIQVFDSYGQPVDCHNMAAYYGRVTPAVAAEKPAGEWQSVDVTLYKRHLTVVLNGVKIIDNVPVVGITGGAMTADEFVNGPLYIQGDHSDADFRNMVLTPLN
ncbi:MAG: DUF1080 domain-containing protein [Kiritimatiellae bacterium]|nr:DUF1080 domain-containing protein [Kiritimatiellia bacterium]